MCSSDLRGGLSGFSCYGASSVDLAAPGSGIYSTVPGQAYSRLSGTSMATPHVSGLAALVWMYRPALTMPQVKEVLMSSVSRSAALDGKVLTGGRINARRALEVASAFEAPQPPAHAPRGLRFEDTDSRVGSMAGVVTITAAADESDVEYYTVYFVSRAGFQMSSLGSVRATGAKLLEVPFSGSAVPPFAAALVAVSGNATGEMPAWVVGSRARAALEDTGTPESGPQAVSWGGDLDPRSGFVSGALSVVRAVDEATITQYNVYWSDGPGARGPLVGSI